VLYFEEIEKEHGLVSMFRDQVYSSLNKSPKLSPLIHSIKTRIKEPTHLKEKLLRKMLESAEKGEKFDITKDNILVRINDLAGIRLLHIHTHQIKDINTVLRDLFDEQKLKIKEKPFARTWDDEYRKFFQSTGFETQSSETMYTSVHYIIESASRTPVTCELQVRTLMEEVWGEVDHRINYPDPVDSVPCREQIRALARATSTVTRLVDSIFASYDDFKGRASATEVTQKKKAKKIRK